jgi:hypothetical protein
VIWCEPFTMFLWGLPYELRVGQSPRDICERARGDWMYLGDGFGGCMRHCSEEERQLVAKFLHKIGRVNLPSMPCEFIRLDPYQRVPF